MGILLSEKLLKLLPLASLGYALVLAGAGLSACQWKPRIATGGLPMSGNPHDSANLASYRRMRIPLGPPLVVGHVVPVSRPP